MTQSWNQGGAAALHLTETCSGTLTAIRHSSWRGLAAFPFRRYVSARSVAAVGAIIQGEGSMTSMSSRPVEGIA